MPKLIQDKFTSMNLSRQRKYQLRRQARKCCPQCGQPNAKGKMCRACLDAARDRMRLIRSPIMDLI